MEHPLCVLCRAQGRRTFAMIRDHIVPLAEGGADDSTNEQALCRACTDTKTRAEAARGRQRSRQRGGIGESLGAGERKPFHARLRPYTGLGPQNEDK